MKTGLPSSAAEIFNPSKAWWIIQAPWIISLPRRQQVCQPRYWSRLFGPSQRDRKSAKWCGGPGVYVMRMRGQKM
ncbi:unnamed protein product [Nezara viridula]|uniref:Uncharacterized protein n=1 Tax=Nezara viridula TaxID=85310 RepID=A0A9P0HNR9_NEZVI|nr:unnamed protein product [Nezara viridula]